MKQHGVFGTDDDSACVEKKMHVASGRQASEADAGVGRQHLRKEPRKGKKTEKEQPEREKKIQG